MSRKPIIAGNWKMNLLQADAKALFEGIKSFTKDFTAQQLPTVVIAPVFTSLNVVETERCNCGCGGDKIAIAGQNCHWEKSGAFTGEVSADMLLELGVEYVVIGHSERRTYFGETDQTVNLRTLKALEKGLKPIICVGETLEQRELGYTETLLKYQTKMALTNVTADQLKNVVIAYEPVWAIGTGVTATADQADEGNGFVRAAIAEAYGADVAETVTIQYGGSMNAKNADELTSKVNVDGGLIGGASLKAQDFSVIVKAASK